jgi:imidazoleglycerol-phosphate dehydratase
MKKTNKAPATPLNRTASISRETKETNIQLKVNLDGTGVADIVTGIGFFDHMLNALAKHGALDLTLRCCGDREVDAHHSVEDVGLVLGEALNQALGEKRGIRRFGFASVPLDEALAQATVDLSGRPFFAFSGRKLLQRGKLGDFDVELAEDFFGALATAAKLTLHLELRAGRNAHHLVEAMFKACARALREALEFDPRADGIPSTKGAL